MRQSQAIELAKIGGVGAGSSWISYGVISIPYKFFHGSGGHFALFTHKENLPNGFTFPWSDPEEFLMEIALGFVDECAFIIILVAAYTCMEFIADKIDDRSS